MGALDRIASAYGMGGAYNYENDQYQCYPITRWIKVLKHMHACTIVSKIQCACFKLYAKFSVVKFSFFT